MKGQVKSGMGKGSFFTSLSWFYEEVQQKLGFSPYPGTLNLQLTSEEARKVQSCPTEGELVNPPDPQYCGALCHPVLIEGVIWGALVRPVATSHPPEVVEIIAPVSLRESLNLQDGDSVIFDWDQGPKPWSLTKEEQLADYKVFKINQRRAISPRLSCELDFYAIDTPDWVQVLPVSVNEELIMVRQFRHGTREITLELPGGLVEKGLSPEESAQKELAEEIGYTGKSLIYLGKVRPNPAILTNWCYFFLAEDLVVEKKTQDEGEDLYVLPVAINKIPGLIRAGVINHSLAVTGYYHYLTR